MTALNSLATPEEEEEKTKAHIMSHLSDKAWRLDNLYHITNKQGKKIKFKMNWAQRLLLKGMWYLNIILKARQLGMSTFILIYMLDTCLFNSDMRTGVIAHSKDDAMVLFRDKIKYAYENLPRWLKEQRPANTDTARELLFSNGSSIRVGTSLRSGTLQILHVSEFGKICQKYPEKAREIITGALNTVDAGQMIFIESTAEGREGRFFDMCMDAQKLQNAGTTLTKLDFKQFFFPWQDHPDYVLDATNVIIFPYLADYFDELELKYGIKLSIEQKAWYVKKKAVQADDMKREYPATPEEAFEQSIQGAYFAEQLKLARLEKRIGKVPHQAGYQVDTWWDLGMNDTQCCWFTQTIGTAIHVIDYYESSGEGLQHYKDMLDKRTEELGYKYGRHVWPHDGTKRNHENGVLVKLNVQAAAIGWIVEIHPRTKDLIDDINNARNFISNCWFDEEKCDSILTASEQRTGGLLALENFRKEWNEHLGCWKRTPLHDWASHSAAAFRTLAGTFQIAQHSYVNQQRRIVVKRKPTGWT